MSEPPHGYEDAVSHMFPVTDKEVARGTLSGTPTPPPSEFEHELESLLNRYSIENESDTPDFILALFLRRCLNMWASAVQARDRWYGFKPWPRELLPAPEDQG